MATKVLRSIKGRAVRLTRLDDCGNIVYGTASTVVSHGFITVTISEELEDGDEYTSKNAWGEFCINEKDPSLLKYANVSIDFCEVDPDILDILGGATPVIVGSDTIGWTRGPAAPVGSVAVEVWTKKVGADACGVGGSPEWGYFLVPFVKNGKIDGDINIGNEPMDITLVGEGYGAPAGWLRGPYNDKPWLVTGGFPAGEMYGALVTTVQPPTPTVGAAPLADKATVDAGDVFAADPAVTAQDSGNAAALAGLGYVVDPAHATAWATGEFFSIGTFKFNWSGSAWAAGVHA